MNSIFDTSTSPNAPLPDNNKRSPSSKAKKAIIITILAALIIIFLIVGIGGVLIYQSRSSALGGNVEQKQLKTKLEAFQAKAGTVLVKSYSNITAIVGTPSGVVGVEAMELQDRSSGSRALGLVIDVKPAGEYTQHSRAFIDFDEIESLLKGIDYISKVTGPTAPLKNFEAHYKTRGDFSIITFNQSDGTIGVSVTGGVLSSNEVFLLIQDLSKLRQAIVTAKETLEKVAQ